MILPALLAVLAMVAYPLAFATYYGFMRVLPLQPAEFVGLANYSAMARDPDFAEALGTTLLFTAVSAGLSFFAGLGLALLLSKPFPGRGAVAAAVFLPWVLPPVAAAALGRLALFEGIGPLGGVAEALGIGGGGPLLVDRDVLFSGAVLVDVWRTAPFVALLLLAGLRTIPKDVYEAARADGANAPQRLFGVTLPLLKPALLVVLLVRLLDAFRVFDLFRVMGDRGIQSLSTYVHENVMISQTGFGLGNAAAVVLFLCALMVSLFFVFILRAQASTGLARSGLQGGEDNSIGEARHAPIFGAVGGFLAVLFLVPLAWVFWISIANPPGFGPGGGTGPGPSLLSYPAVLADVPLAVGLANSAFIAGTTTVLVLVLACPAAYAIARLCIPYANGLLGALLAVAFFPPVAVLVPLFVQMRGAGLLGTQLGAIVPDVAFFLPFAIWLLATFFRELPAEVEDAARVDGAGRLRVLTAVIAPLAAPSLFATGAFVFVLAWNELIFASTFTLGGRARPVTVVLADLVAQASTGSPGPLAAGSLIAALPPAVLFLAFRRRILAGLTDDALGDRAPPGGDAERFPAPLLRRTAAWAATTAFLFAGAWAASLFARHGLDALAFPYPLNYGEGPLLDQAVRLAALENIYPSDISKPPYVVSNYPPLFVLLQAPLVWAFGPEFWYGRAISLASTVAAAVLIAQILHALTRDRTASAAGGLSFLAVPFVLHWSSLDRVDALGLALTLAGLHAVVRSPDRRGVVLASLLLVAAIYTRQTFALAAPLAAFTWLLACGQRRPALALAALTGGPSLLLLWVLNVLTGGGFFFHTVTSNVNEFRWDRVVFHLSTTQSLMPILLLGGLAFLILGLRSRAASWWLLVSYLLGSAATALLIGKVGSDVNYLLELSAALALVGGMMLAHHAERPGLRAALLLALAVQAVMVVQASQAFYAGLQANVIAQRTGIVRLEEVVAGSEKSVLADEHAGLLPLAGKRLYLQPFEMTQRAREGGWDQGPLLRSIRHQEFSAILIWKPSFAPGIEEERWTSQMLSAVEENYEPAETHAGTVVYRPRNKP